MMIGEKGADLVKKDGGYSPVRTNWVFSFGTYVTSLCLPLIEKQSESRQWEILFGPFATSKSAIPMHWF
jgi:hypothetical protein